MIKILRPPLIDLPHDAKGEKSIVNKSKTDISMFCALTARGIDAFLHGQYDGIFFKTRDCDIVAEDYCKQLDLKQGSKSEKPVEGSKTCNSTILVGALDKNIPIEIYASDISDEDEINQKYTFAENLDAYIKQDKKERKELENSCAKECEVAFEKRKKK